MGLAKIKQSYSAEYYLKLERSSEERYEYLDGEIYLMAGESEAHGDICTNIVREISTQLKGTPCRVRSKDTKVRSGAIEKLRLTNRGLFSYPDAVVICGATQFHDEEKDVVTNPTVIIEVLSLSTAEFDRGEKFMRYRNWNPTLTDYLLISQDKPLVEHFVRQTDGNWLFLEHRDVHSDFRIESINCTLSLSEIYDRVDVPDLLDDEFI